MSPILTITLEGKGAKEIAERLVANSAGAAKERDINVPVQDHRGIDYLAIVDFFKLIAPIATSIGGIAVTANFIIQRIQSLRKKASSAIEITIVIYVDNDPREFPIYENLTEEAQEELVRKVSEALKSLE
jgi:hypothetical protein